MGQIQKVDLPEDQKSRIRDAYRSAKTSQYDQ